MSNDPAEDANQPQESPEAATDAERARRPYKPFATNPALPYKPYTNKSAPVDAAYKPYPGKLVPPAPDKDK